jgi:hypothetical protein
MRDALIANESMGNDRFRERIMRELGRSIGQAKRGRPTVRRGDEG